MIISVASGKGGTGKTTVALNLALSIEENVNLLDADVEEPNCHIFLPQLQYDETVIQATIPEIDVHRCNLCGKCAEVCQFNAIAVLPRKKVLVFDELCHSCGGCFLFCPNRAIKELSIDIGKVKSAVYKNLNFYYGEIKVGYPMAPPVIKALKKNIEKDRINIIDCPPGTSCPAIESVKDSDYCVLVSDSTPFGINDLILSLKALRALKIPFGVVINRCDIADDSLERYCKHENIPILMQIPEDRRIAEAYSVGDLIVDALPEYRDHFKSLFNNLKEAMQ